LEDELKNKQRILKSV
jgi:chromosome segregation ATPase